MNIQIHLVINMGEKEFVIRIYDEIHIDKIFSEKYSTMWSFLSSHEILYIYDGNFYGLLKFIRVEEGGEYNVVEVIREFDNKDDMIIYLRNYKIRKFI